MSRNGPCEAHPNHSHQTHTHNEGQSRATSAERAALSRHLPFSFSEADCLRLQNKVEWELRRNSRACGDQRPVVPQPGSLARGGRSCSLTR